MNPRVSKMSPRGAQDIQNGTQVQPKDPQSEPKGVHGEPRASKVIQRLQKRCPRGLHVEKLHTEQLKMYLGDVTAKPFVEDSTPPNLKTRENINKL